MTLAGFAKVCAYVLIAGFILGAGLMAGFYATIATCRVVLEYEQ